jgi:hypothetical protein
LKWHCLEPKTSYLEACSVSKEATKAAYIDIRHNFLPYFNFYFRHLETVANLVHDLLFLWMGSKYVSELRPLFIPQVMNEYGEPRWNDIDRGKPKNFEKNPVPVALVHHKYHMTTWTDPGANPGLRGERRVT